MRIKSLEAAAAFVDRVGIAVAWGKADLVLPSLWRGIAGLDADWAIRDENGKPTGFTPEFDRLWRWKDELPERRLACAEKHSGRSCSPAAGASQCDAYLLRTRRAASWLSPSRPPRTRFRLPTSQVPWVGVGSRASSFSRSSRPLDG